MTSDQKNMLSGDEAVAQTWAAVVDAVAVSRRAPLSARHALHAAVLIDQLSDKAFARRPALPLPALATAGDFLAFRAGLRASDPSLGPIMDLTACGADGTHLEILPTQVAPDAFSGLPVADLMVSLYNAGEVPRLMLVQRDGGIVPMQHLLQEATRWWGTILGD